MENLRLKILIIVVLGLVFGIGILIYIFHKSKNMSEKEKIAFLRRFLGEDSKYDFKRKELNWVLGWSPNFPPRALAFIITIVAILVLLIYFIDKLI